MGSKSFVVLFVRLRILKSGESFTVKEPIEKFGADHWPFLLADQPDNPFAKMDKW